MRNRLYRDEYNKKIGGVCAGLAEYFNVDVTLVRAIFLIALICKGGGGLIYFVLWAVIPRKPFVAGSFESFANPQPQPQTFAPVKTSPSAFTLVSGILLILLGGFLLLDQYNIIPNFDFNTFWPIALIVVGLFLMFGFWQRKPHQDAPANFGGGDNGAASSSTDSQEPI
jgi:phage shock protein PspC (stress-responsive transcriptional regulator)